MYEAIKELVLFRQVSLNANGCRSHFFFLAVFRITKSLLISLKIDLISMCHQLTHRWQVAFLRRVTSVSEERVSERVADVLGAAGIRM